jgi:hypothetical protein
MNADYACFLARLTSNHERVVEAWLAWDEWVLVVARPGSDDCEPLPSTYSGLRVLQAPPVQRWRCVACGADRDLTDDGYCPECSTGGFEGGAEAVVGALQARLEKLRATVH